jgi:hypothetical protein
MNYYKENRATYFSIIGKIWMLGSGLITTMLVGFYFPPALQGYYYTFNSLLIFLVFAELGLTTVIISFSSNEWIKIKLDENGIVVGDVESISKLTSLARFAIKWYFNAGIIVTITLIIGGFIFFTTRPTQVENWAGPWILLCLVTALNLFLMPVLAFLEGCNQVINIYKFRFIQYIASSLAAWLSIYYEAGLWLSSITGIVGLLTITTLVVSHYRLFLVTFFIGKPKGTLLNWRKDILPMQWRIGLSWIGGYFTFAMFTPILFYFHGPIIAGQMGMTWSFVSALMILASAWVAPKATYFGLLISQEKYGELDRVFFKLTLEVIALTLSCAIAVWSMVLILNYLNHPLALRLLAPSTTAFLLLASTLYCLGLPVATYLRAHKKEPLTLLSINQGLFTSLLVIILAKSYAANGVALGYLLVTLIVTPFLVLIWYRRRNEWHKLN